IGAVYTTAANTGSPVGDYAITPLLLDPEHRLSNYYVTILDGRFIVTPAPLTVTADDRTRIYGSANPAFTASYDGFILGQGPSVLGGTLTFTTAAATTSNVGTYALTPGGLTSSNYAIHFVAGTLTVTPAPLSATVDNVSKVYGAPNPLFTVSYSGFV